MFVALFAHSYHKALPLPQFEKLITFTCILEIASRNTASLALKASQVCLLFDAVHAWMDGWVLFVCRKDMGHSDALKGIVGGLAASAVAVG